MLAPSARLRGRAVRCARRRPVRSLSATIDTFAFGSVQPRCSGATTIDPPAFGSVSVRLPSRTGKSRPLPSSRSCRRAAEPAPSAATTTRKPRPISSVRRSVRPVAVAGDRAPSPTPRPAGCRAIPASSRSTRTTARPVEQRVGVGVEAGEAAVGVACPRRRERAGEVVLLGEQVDRPGRASAAARRARPSPRRAARR